MLELLRFIFTLSRYKIWSHLTYLKLPGKFSNIVKALALLEKLLRPLHVSQDNFGNNLQQALQKLGPIYIKMGQTLATRSDIIGQSLADALSQLHDKLPSFPSEVAEKIIKEELNQTHLELFSEFSREPISAASIAQVHKATLTSGKVVAVKIMRPNIEKEYAKNIKFFYWLGNIVHKIFPHFRIIEIVEIFEKTMKQELDFAVEAASYSEMRDNFINDHTVYIPEVYWHATSKKILTTSWVEGTSIYNRHEITRLGLDPKAIASSASIMFFNQSYRDGFFHADLHPGNIFVTKNGVVALVDFGIVGRLSEKDRLAVAEIVLSIVKRNYKNVARAHMNAGYIDAFTDLDAFAQRCRIIFEPISGLPLRQISLARILEQICALTEDFGMKAQPQLILLQKSMVIIEGIGLSLDNEINMWEIITPWIKKWAAKNLSPEARILKYIKSKFRKAIA